jgi:primosomal protein N' (replication factor Y) (superfamily II helicase)
LLALDKPFTYDLPPELVAGVGSYVRFRFHGKLTRGWVLGPTDDVPPRMLPVMRAVSPVWFFDAPMLALARWVAERYVTPLASVLGALSPPRVAGEEEREPIGRDVVSRAAAPPSDDVLRGYANGSALLDAMGRIGGDRAWLARPAPDDEVAIVVQLVATVLAAGRAALVLVPDADPVPFTANELLRVFGPRVGLFLGGDRRDRYRRWLEIADGRYDVVVGTRSAVFAPVSNLGVIVVCRESHPGFREERAPYHHARDIALARTRAGPDAPVCVLSAFCPSSEAAALRLPRVAPRVRRWPKVEVVRPGTEGRAPRLVDALRHVRRAFIYAPLPGYGVAQVCRSCGSPAACAACGGMLRVAAGVLRCVVCEAIGRCAVCGGTTFGIRRGGAERVEGWVSRFATVPVARPETPRLPADGGEVLVGGADSVRDLGPAALDLVAILDADLAARRPGLTARERGVAIWMEAVSWARPAGRVIVQSTMRGDPAVQAVVRGDAERFHERERERRAAAGFPVGAPVFRVVGNDDLPEELAMHSPITTLTTSLGGRTVCLLALDAGRVPAFGAAMRRLASAGVVERVEAEPHI